MIILKLGGSIITDKDSETIHQINLTESSKVDVTGGMIKKVSEIIDLGIETRIINANKPNNVLKALQGEAIGTIIQ